MKNDDMKSFIMQVQKLNKEFTRLAIISLFMMILSSCSKKHDSPEIIEDPPVDDSSIIDPVDPPIASTMGLFMDGWQPKTFQVPPYIEGKIAADASAIVTVDIANVITKIPLTMFGHLSLIHISEPTRRTPIS